MPDANYSIVITGEWPGAGQSTTAKLLAQKLGFKRVYAGMLQRRFANAWNIEKQHRTWDEFVKLFSENKIKLDDYPFNESDFNEKINHQWTNQLKEVGIPEMWDKIIDTHSLQALKQPGVVVEAKVGVLLDQTGLDKLQGLQHRIYKVLLVCPPEISTHRVLKRKIENGEIQPMDKDSEMYQELVRDTTTDIIDRHLKDWERYEVIYGIKRSDIYKKGIIKVNTSQKTQEEVVDSIIDIVNYKEAHRHQKSRN